MGQTAAQTRDEIVQLRAGMTDHVVTLKTAAQRPVRIAKFALLIGAGLVVGGVGVVVVVKLRQRAKARSPIGRLRALADAPKKAQDELERKRMDLRQNLRRALTGPWRTLSCSWATRCQSCWLASSIGSSPKSSF
jgi:hypothetical protein